MNDDRLEAAWWIFRLLQFIPRYGVGLANRWSRACGLGVRAYYRD